MHADEVDVDDELVSVLIAEQFRQYARLPIRRAASTGTDNAIYRLGDHLGVRLPRIHWAVPQVDKEHEWLPRLAPHLPTSLPEPVAIGEPAEGYPYRWLVYQWIDGRDAIAALLQGVDWVQLAEDVATFVLALQRVETNGAPPAGVRGGPIGVTDEFTRSAIARLDGLIDTRRALAVWEQAISARPLTAPPVWVHADLLPGNLVVRDGRIAGVIDWSAAGVGDPACDAMVAWAMPPAARAQYRAALNIDEDTWARGRGWAIEQAAHFIPYYATTIPDGVAAARRRLDAAIADA
jgi:aminoglycoside phosphotransferase (APT) family kinase protein